MRKKIVYYFIIVLSLFAGQFGLANNEYDVDFYVSPNTNITIKDVTVSNINLAKNNNDEDAQIYIKKNTTFTNKNAITNATLVFEKKNTIDVKSTIVTTQKQVSQVSTTNSTPQKTLKQNKVHYYLSQLPSAAHSIHSDNTVFVIATNSQNNQYKTIAFALGSKYSFNTLFGATIVPNKIFSTNSTLSFHTHSAYSLFCRPPTV